MESTLPNPTTTITSRQSVHNNVPYTKTINKAVLKKKKKIKRSKKNKKHYKNFTIYHVNIRGIKSKTKTLKTIIEDKKPTVVCITETHLSDKDSYEIDGYRIFRNNRNEDGGGTLVAVQKFLKEETIEVEKVQNIEETLWIKINNKKLNLRIGVIYGPQESERKEDIEGVYDRLQTQINIAKTKNEQVIIIGDYNAKVKITKNKETQEESKAGKILEQFTKRNDLFIVNKSPKANGVWTREDPATKGKSALDYAIVDNYNEERINRFDIDEERYWTPYHVKDGKEVYSDHNAMILDMKYDYEIHEHDEMKKVMKFTDNSKVLYQQKTNDGTLTRIANRRMPINKKYKLWEKTVKEYARKTFTKTTKDRYTNKNKSIRTLMKNKNNIKKQIKQTKNDNIRKNLLKRKLRLANKLMEESENQDQMVKGKNIASKIQKAGGVSSPNFWEILKVKAKNKENKIAMKDEKGKVKEETIENLTIYQKHYENLLQTTIPESEEEVKAELEVENAFKKLQSIENKTNAQEITEEELQRVLKELKTKKAPDSGGMRNEFIKYGGEDLRKSLVHLLNEIMSQGEIPNKWKSMTIKSLYKKKGDRREMKNQRGIFLTNIVSKIFERILLQRNRSTIEQHMSKFQCGGRKGRGTVDHLFQLRATIDEYRYKKKDLHIFYGDLQKCFDKLWLRDTIIELWKSGMCPREVMMIYKLNKEARILVQTPFGQTEEFKANEIVRQGTVWGPTLCAISTDKVNSIQAKVYDVYGSIRLEPMVYVDDICHAGDENGSETTVKNCKRMEEKKKMTFNNQKSQFQIMKFGKKSKGKNVMKTEVKQGKIKRCETYNYLGDITNEKGDYNDSIEKKRTKSKGVSACIKQHAMKAGNLYFEVSIKLVKIILITYISYGVETWSNMSSKEINEMEKIQKDSLYNIFQISSSTPYLALLSELGLFTMRDTIIFKKLKLYYDLSFSDNDRVAKKILQEQIKLNRSNSWYNEIKFFAKDLGIKLEDMTCYSKREWSDMIKSKILERANNNLLTLGTKSRFISNHCQKTYITSLSKKKAIVVLRLRLNMIDLKDNFKHKFIENKCPMCEKEKDSTEHLFECKEYPSPEGNIDKVLQNEDMAALESELDNVMKRLEKRDLI